MSRAWGVVAAGLVVAGGVVGVVVALRPPSMRLMDLAKLTARLASGARFHWLSPSRLLVEARTGTQVLDGETGRDVTTEFRTGPRRVVPDLANDWLESRQRAVLSNTPWYGDHERPRVGGAGRGQRGASSASSEVWVCASENALWLPYSRRWIVLSFSSAAQGLVGLVEPADSTRVLKGLPLGLPRGTTSGWDLMQSRLLGLTSRKRVLATIAGTDYYPSAAPQRTINFYDFSVDGSTPVLHQYTIELPRDDGQHAGDIALGSGEDVVLSPGGDRLAWLIYRGETPSRLERVLGRWLPALRGKRRVYAELRTSRVDGTDQKVVGRVELKPNVAWFLQPDLPEAIQWTPDGSGIRFIYRDALYTVPAK